MLYAYLSACAWSLSDLRNRSLSLDCLMQPNGIVRIYMQVEERTVPG